VLIVGGPDQVPFRIQSLLGVAAAVGRLDFDSVRDLKPHVDKVVRLETAPHPTTSAEEICFAPDGGPKDATYFSRRFMAEPLVDRIRSRGFRIPTPLLGDDATKTNLQSALENGKPTLVYTASNGAVAKDESFEVQKRLNGAICCQRLAGGPSDDRLYSADDVPLDRPFLEGAIWFQFACFGYGTPAESDFNHWRRKPQMNTTHDFVAALPKRLVAHSRDPAAFVGHVDLAIVYTSEDPNDPLFVNRWHDRLEPFAQAVDVLLEAQPVGIAMADMSKRYDVGNALLTSAFDNLQRDNPQLLYDPAELVEAFITRNDAQNYFVFGDPAVRLRMSTD
jgi:hypothetical protein